MVFWWVRLKLWCFADINLRFFVEGANVQKLKNRWRVRTWLKMYWGCKSLLRLRFCVISTLLKSVVQVFFLGFCPSPIEKKQSSSSQPLNTSHQVWTGWLVDLQPSIFPRVSTRNVSPTAFHLCLDRWDPSSFDGDSRKLVSTCTVSSCRRCWNVWRIGVS